MGTFGLGLNYKEWAPGVTAAPPGSRRPGGLEGFPARDRGACGGAGKVSAGNRGPSPVEPDDLGRGADHVQGVDAPQGAGDGGVPHRVGEDDDGDALRVMLGFLREGADGNALFAQDG